MLDAKDLEARFLAMTPGASLNKIRRAKSKRNTNPRYLNRLLVQIRQRCYNPHDSNSDYYRSKGIECRLNVTDLRYLWKRDGAESMDRATIDRINVHGHYELANCRFVEQSLNTSRAAVDSWLRRPDGVIVEVLPAPRPSCAAPVAPAQ